MHIARDCSTPDAKRKGKSKGKGKGKGKGGTGKASVSCSHCKKLGHTHEKRFILHPELRKKGAYHVEKEAEEEADCGLLGICAIEAYTKQITTNNRFVALSQEDDVSVGNCPKTPARDTKPLGICPQVSSR